MALNRCVTAPAPADERSIQRTPVRAQPVGTPEATAQFAAEVAFPTAELRDAYRKDPRCARRTIVEAVADAAGERRLGEGVDEGLGAAEVLVVSVLQDHVADGEAEVRGVVPGGDPGPDGEVEIEVPRDRTGDFEPKLVKKR